VDSVNFRYYDNFYVNVIVKANNLVSYYMGAFDITFVITTSGNYS
jgi:hypothetical protein